MVNPYFDKKGYRELSILLRKRSQLFSHDLGQSADRRLVSLIVCPLPDACDLHETSPLQRCKIIGHSRLRKSNTFLDTADTDPHGVNVAFILRREVLHGIPQ